MSRAPTDGSGETRHVRAPDSKGTAAVPKGRKAQRRRKAPSLPGGRGRPSGAGLGLSQQERIVAGAIAVGLVAAVLAGLLTGRAFPWVVAVALVGVAILVFGLAPATRGTPGGFPGGSSGETGDLEEAEMRERAAQAPFSVRTSLVNRHLLRIAEQARHEDVIPVSGGHRTQFLIESRSEVALTVTEVRPVVAARRTAREGDPIVASTGSLPQPHFDLDLDADPPDLVPTDAGGGGGDPSAVRFPVVVDPGGIELLVVSPRTGDEEVDWHLELDWVCGDVSGTLTVDQGGRPFRLTPERGWATFYPDEGSSA